MKNSIKINKKFLKNKAKLITALNFIKNTDFNTINDGKINIDGSNIWANIQTYLTKNDAKFEAHRKYIDLQYIISGEEKIEVCDYLCCKTDTAYNELNDIEFLESKASQTVTLHKGDFLILYPTDAHKPSISIDKYSPSNIRKLVVKIKTDY